MGVATAEAASGHVRETFVPASNARFGKLTADSLFGGNAGPPPADVPCVQTHRRVGRDKGGLWFKRSSRFGLVSYTHLTLPTILRV